MHPAATQQKLLEAILEKIYGNPHKILSSHQKEIKEWSQLKFGDAKDFRKFSNFLLNCESVFGSQDWNVLDIPEMLRVQISKLPRGFMDMWNWTVQAIRRKQIRESELQDLIQWRKKQSSFSSLEPTSNFTYGNGSHYENDIFSLSNIYNNENAT